MIDYSPPGTGFYTDTNAQVFIRDEKGEMRLVGIAISLLEQPGPNAAATLEVVKTEHTGKKEQDMPGRDRSTHTTKDGETIALAGMQDSHLMATIALFSQRMTEATKLVEAQDSKPDRTGRQAALYGKTQQQSMDPAQYRRMVAGYYEKIGPYIAEACLRETINISDVRNIVRAALGRQDMDPMAPAVSVGSTILNTQGGPNTQQAAMARAIDRALVSGEAVDLGDFGIQIEDVKGLPLGG